MMRSGCGGFHSTWGTSPATAQAIVIRTGISFTCSPDWLSLVR